MIKETVNESHFTNALMSDTYASWSYGATKALYEYYVQLSEDIGEDIEPDRVAIRCEWSEYPTAWEAMKEYQPDDMPVIDLEEYTDEDGTGPDLLEVAELEEKAAREWLEDRTTVLDVENIDFSGGERREIRSILIQQF
jgi:S-adenosylmethionine synthetase